MTAEELLEHAAALITRRRREYGVPVNLFECVAVRWSQVLGTRVTPAQVVVCLVDLKVARLTHDPRALRQHHRHRGLCRRAAWRRCCPMRELRSRWSDS